MGVAGRKRTGYRRVGLVKNCLEWLDINSCMMFENFQYCRFCCFIVSFFYPKVLFNEIYTERFNKRVRG